MQKKIAIIIERADIVLGGAERSVFELAAALSSIGLQVDILAAKGQTEARKIHILCDNKKNKRTSLNHFASVLKDYIFTHKYDIVHSVLPLDFADIYQPRGGSVAESILRNAASYPTSPGRIYKRLTSFLNLRRAGLLHAEKKLCKNSKGPIVAALSEYVAEQFRTHYNLRNDRLVVIENGVKTHKEVETSQADKLRAQILKRLEIREADNPAFFLFVANNFRLKGLRCLLKAIKTAQSLPAPQHAYFIIAGHGKSYNYRLLARQLGINKKIVFLGQVRNIQNILSISDVAVLPTFYDPASRFILEALSADKPVITTKFNGATDLFTNDRHGKIIDSPRNINALAEAISYYTDKSNREKTTQAIICDNIKEKVSITRAANQLNELYDSIIENRRKI